jgi:hypothetical protein
MLHQIQSELGVQKSEKWDSLTQAAWAKIIDEKYSGPAETADLLKTKWIEAAKDLKYEASPSGALQFIKDLKADKFSTKTQAVGVGQKPADISPVGEATTPELVQQGFTSENLKQIMLKLTRAATSLKDNAGNELLPAAKVMKRSEDYIDRLEGLDSAVQKLSQMPGLSYFQNFMSNPDQLMGVVYLEMEKQARPGFIGDIRRRRMERRRKKFQKK